MEESFYAREHFSIVNSFSEKTFERMKLLKFISYEFIRKRTAKIYANYDQISRAMVRSSFI